MLVVMFHAFPMPAATMAELTPYHVVWLLRCWRVPLRRRAGVARSVNLEIGVFFGLVLFLGLFYLMLPLLASSLASVVFVGLIFYLVGAIFMHCVWSCSSVSPGWSCTWFRYGSGFAALTMTGYSLFMSLFLEVALIVA